jgi:hypothetical protein
VNATAQPAKTPSHPKDSALPFTGRWRVYFLLGLLVAAGWGKTLIAPDLHVRMYLAFWPDRPYYCHELPSPGCDCRRRMGGTFYGEVSRSFRIGELIFEVSQDYGLMSPATKLDGPDCH